MGSLGVMSTIPGIATSSFIGNKSIHISSLPCGMKYASADLSSGMMGFRLDKWHKPAMSRDETGAPMSWFPRVPRRLVSSDAGRAEPVSLSDRPELPATNWTPYFLLKFETLSGLCSEAVKPTDVWKTEGSELPSEPCVIWRPGVWKSRWPSGADASSLPNPRRSL